MSKRIITILLVVLMVGALAACNQGGTTGAKKDGAADPAKPASDLPFVTLTFYMMGEVGEDVEAYHEIFDEWTKRDFNAVVQWKHCNTWVDYAAKYNLMLTTDATVDLCYSANWINYATYARKDAYLALDDLLPVYAPNVWNDFPEGLWDGVSVDGNIYAVPQYHANYHGEFFWYREDLRKKYDLPDMSSLDLDLLENYMKVVLENEPQFQFAMPFLYTSQNAMFNAHQTKYIGIDATALNMRAERDNLKNTILYYEQPEYVAFAERMKKWCEMGFWSKSALANADDTDHSDLFAEEIIFVANNAHLDRGSGIPEKLIKEGKVDAEIGFLPWASIGGHYYGTRSQQDLTCIPASSKNPERALMVFDKMMTNREYYDLNLYGIEGLNYEFDEEGAISHVNIDTTAHNFDLCLWALRNDNLAYPSVSLWAGRTAWEKENYPKLEYDPFDGIALELDAVQAEFAAITQVNEEYGKPIEWGLVDDPAAAIENFKQRLETAGMAKFKAEMDRQIAAFIDAKKD